MNVLSLFDGMSCGQLAMNQAGIKYDNYYASEIDKYAITVTQYNYPNTIQLGDVTKVSGHDLPKIDLLLGGSPCQGFSFAGRQLNFDDQRSKLFFEYVRILKECREKNPDIKFLLENVRMKKESRDIISEYLGVEPIKINSALVSAQNRVRLYWTNINKGGIDQPEDKGIKLKDIIENGYVDRDKSYCVDANYFKGGNLKNYFLNCRRQLVFEKPHGWNKGGVKEKDKFNTLRACTAYNCAIKDSNKWRKLLPVECERLQTVPDNYTDVVSNAQRYKMLGNGWTVDVIVHILNYLKKETS